MASQPLFGIDAREVAHEIVAGVGAGDRQRGIDVAADLAQIARQQFADVLLEDVERRPLVDGLDDVVVGLGDAMHRADRRAALGQPGGDRHAAGEQHAGEAALDDAIGDLRMLAARGGEAADEEQPEIVGHAGDDVGRQRIAGIAMDEAEERLGGLEPAAILGAERPEAAMHRLEHAEGIGRQRRHHHRDRRAVEILGASAGAVAAGDADAGGADPIGDARAAAQAIEDALEMVHQLVGDVEEAEIGRRRDRAESFEAGIDGLPPVLMGRMGAVEGRAHEPGALRSSRWIACST